MHGHQAMHKHRPHDGGDKTRNRSRGSHAPAQPSHPTKPDSAANGKKKKRKTNTLGLVPGEDTEEDDENEEERLNDMYGADAPK